MLSGAGFAGKAFLPPQLISWKAEALSATGKQRLRNQGKMKLIEEINLPNGLQLNIFDLSREIAADTVKVEIAVQTNVHLQESFFSNRPDYEQVKNIFGAEIFYEYKLERTFVPRENCDTVREDLINTFKNNSLSYFGAENFAGRLAAAKLRDIKKNPYKYRNRTDNEL